MTTDIQSSSSAPHIEMIMSTIQARLDTFLRWPDDVPALPVSPHSLAEAGFYVNRNQRSEPNLSQTRCFSCGLCIDNWREGDVPVQRHREEMPNCPFMGEIEIGEVPTSDRIDNRVEDNRNNVAQLEENGRVLDGVQIANHEGILEDIPRELYQFEEMRVQSFLHWPIPDIVSPMALARAGFYALNPNSSTSSDSVQCAFCEGAVGSWERGDCPDREHRRHFPLCPFVVNTINPRLGRWEGRSGDVGADNAMTLDRAGRNLNVHVVNGSGMGNLQELGVHTHTAPRKPRFTSLSARLASFTGWPPHLIQTPAVLAEAGFYYEHPNQLAAANNVDGGSAGATASDHVRCFHCDGGLKHWDPHDDPWTEHARWFPQCSYVLLVKGAEFVVQASRGAAEGQDGDNRQSTTTTTSTPSTPIPSLPSSTSHPPQVAAVTDRELQIHLQAPPALEALNLGIVVERVKQAIKDKLERTGSGFSNGAALIEAALNLQRDADLEASGTSAGETGVSDVFFQMLKDALDESILVRNERERRAGPSEENSHLPTSPAKDPSTSQRHTNSNMTVLNHQNSVANTSIQNDDKSTPTKDCSKDKSATTSSGVKLSLEEENRLLKEARLCKICMDSEVGIVFLPCGHLATCVQCAPNLQACPVCRSSIRATVRTFLS